MFDPFLDLFFTGLSASIGSGNAAATRRRRERGECQGCGTPLRSFDNVCTKCGRRRPLVRGAWRPRAGDHGWTALAGGVALVAGVALPAIALASAVANRADAATGWASLLLLLSGFVLIGVDRARMQRLMDRRIDHDRCPRCGYDIRASPDRCPECGTRFDDRIGGGQS